MKSIEKSNWFNELIGYNRNEFIAKMGQNENLLDEDFMLVPYIIEKSVLKRVIDFVEDVYDPMSTSQTSNLANLLVTLTNDYPTLNHQSTNTKVSRVFLSKIK